MLYGEINISHGTFFKILKHNDITSCIENEQDFQFSLFSRHMMRKQIFHHNFGITQKNPSSYTSIIFIHFANLTWKTTFKFLEIFVIKADQKFILKKIQRSIIFPEKVSNNGEYSWFKTILSKIDEKAARIWMNEFSINIINFIHFLFLINQFKVQSLIKN